MGGGNRGKRNRIKTSDREGWSNQLVLWGVIVWPIRDGQWAIDMLGLFTWQRSKSKSLGGGSNKISESWGDGLSLPRCGGGGVDFLLSIVFFVSGEVSLERFVCFFVFWSSLDERVDGCVLLCFFGRREGERVGDRCLVTGMAKQARQIVSARTDQRGASDHCASTRATGKMRLEGVGKLFQTPCRKGTSELEKTV